jgi:hypothetical protein
MITAVLKIPQVYFKLLEILSNKLLPLIGDKLVLEFVV